MFYVLKLDDKWAIAGDCTTAYYQRKGYEIVWSGRVYANALSYVNNNY